METPAARIRNLRAELRRAWGIAGPAFVDDPSRVDISRQVDAGGGTFVDAYRRALDNAGPTRAAASVSEPGGMPSQNFGSRLRNALYEGAKNNLIGMAVAPPGFGALAAPVVDRFRDPEKYRRLNRMTGTGEPIRQAVSKWKQLRTERSRGESGGSDFPQEAESSRPGWLMRLKEGDAYLRQILAPGPPPRRKDENDSKGTRAAIKAKGVMRGPEDQRRKLEESSGAPLAQMPEGEVRFFENKNLPEGWELSDDGTMARNVKENRLVIGDELTKMMYRTWRERKAPAQPKGLSLKAWDKLQKIRDEIRRGPAMTVTQALARERWRLFDQARRATTGGTSRAMRYLLAAEKSGELGDRQRTAIEQLGYGPDSRWMAYTAQGRDWLDYRKEIARRQREIEERSASEQATVRRDPKKGK